MADPRNGGPKPMLSRAHEIKKLCMSLRGLRTWDIAGVGEFGENLLEMNVAILVIVWLLEYCILLRMHSPIVIFVVRKLDIQKSKQ